MLEEDGSRGRGLLQEDTRLRIKALDKHYLGSLCGYLDDDKALDCGDPAKIYDQVIAYGASMIQTDRPEQLIKYLRSKGLHD